MTLPQKNIVIAALGRLGAQGTDHDGPHLPGTSGHGASPLLWSILMCRGDTEPDADARARWDAPSIVC